MKVKRYMVDSLNEAMALIRKEMGPDAMIISNKQVKIGGFLGLFAKRKVEVIAAVDEEPQKPSTFKKVMETARHDAEEKTQSLTYPRPHPHSSPTPNQETSAEVKKELQEMRQLLVTMMMGHENVPPALEPLQQIRTHLAEQEVREAVIVDVLDQMMQRQPADYVWTEEVVWQEAKAVLESIFASRIQVPAIAPTTRLVQMVGPTGVGKTTTIAKLAAEQVLKQKKRVALITADTYRIAAVEQLKTYATILNIPFEVVFSVDDLQKALRKCKDYDLIFMDTAGRNFLESQYIAEVEAWMGGTLEERTETYLVLSLTMKDSVLEKIIQQFSSIGIDRLLFTKADETLTYGNLLNLAVAHPYHFSYLTNGQSVPDDIIEVEAKQLANLLLGVNKE